MWWTWWGYCRSTGTDCCVARGPWREPCATDGPSDHLHRPGYRHATDSRDAEIADAVGERLDRERLGRLRHGRAMDGGVLGAQGALRAPDLRIRVERVTGIEPA